MKPMVHPQPETPFLAEYQQKEYRYYFRVPSAHPAAKLLGMQHYCKTIYLTRSHRQFAGHRAV
jgi:hypothetical protein